MRKIIFGMLIMTLPFIYVSNAVAGGKCPFGGSPNWQGVCDATTDSGQSYFGPTLTQEEADQIGPAPLPTPTPTPPPAPETAPTPTEPPVPVQTLLMLALGMLSQNNAVLVQNSAILNMLSQQNNSSPPPSPSPSPSSPTQDSNNSSPDQTVSPSASPSQPEGSESGEEIAQRSFIVKPTISNNQLVVNKKVNPQISSTRAVIVATRGIERKTWIRKINGDTINIKIPRKYLNWKISIRYLAG